MNFEIIEEDKYYIIKPSASNLKSTQISHFKTQILSLYEKGKSIICDLSNIDYLDSSGLSALLVGNRLLKEQNNLFLICNISKKAKEIIHLTKLDNILIAIESFTEAIEYIMFHELEKEL